MKTLLTIAAVIAFSSSAFAGWGTDGNGRYFQTFPNRDGSGGWGINGAGKYYEWHNNGRGGGWGTDGNGRYFEYYQ